MKRSSIGELAFAVLVIPSCMWLGGAGLALALLIGIAIHEIEQGYKARRAADLAQKGTSDGK